MKNVIKIVWMCFMSVAAANVNAATVDIELVVGGTLNLNGASGLDTATTVTLDTVTGSSLNVFGIGGTGGSTSLPLASDPVVGFMSVDGWRLDLSSYNGGTSTASFLEGAGLLFDGDHTHAATWSISAENPTNYSLTVNTTVVPVPAAVWLFGSGLIGLVGVARRKA